MFGILCSTAVILFILFCIFEPYFDYVEGNNEVWVVLWYTNLKYLLIHHCTRRKYVKLIKIK
jgi:hypothetical protein